MGYKKKRKLRLHFSNKIIWTMTIILWLGITTLMGELTTDICKNCPVFSYQIFSWLINLLNLLIAFNIVTKAEILTTPIKIKTAYHKPIKFSEYDVLYKIRIRNITKNITNDTNHFDNLLKKLSLVSSCKPGRYLGFLLLRYLR